MIAEASIWKSLAVTLLSLFISTGFGCVLFFLPFHLTRPQRERRTAKERTHSRCVRRLEDLVTQNANVHPAHMDLLKARIKMEWRRHSAQQQIDAVPAQFFASLIVGLVVGVYAFSNVLFALWLQDGRERSFGYLIGFVLVPLINLGCALYSAVVGPKNLETSDLNIAMANSQLEAVGIHVPAREQLVMEDAPTTPAASVVPQGA